MFDDIINNGITERRVTLTNGQIVIIKKCNNELAFHDIKAASDETLVDIFENIENCNVALSPL